MMLALMVLAAGQYDDWHGTGAPCYPSAPNKQLVINIGVALTTPAIGLWPIPDGAAPHELLAIIQAVNDVFEGQLAIHFNLTVVEHIDFGETCSGTLLETLDKFNVWVATQSESVAFWHLIDGCFDPLCEGDACPAGVTKSFEVCPFPATAVTAIIGQGTWATLAHEFGHNLGAKHPFDENRPAGTIGGLMDYYNSNFDGADQFNTIESKTKMCAGVRGLLERCSSDMYSYRVAPERLTSVEDGPIEAEEKGQVWPVFVMLAVGAVWIPFLITSAYSVMPPIARSALLM
jgi:hypothetical protein